MNVYQNKEKIMESKQDNSALPVSALPVIATGLFAPTSDKKSSYRHISKEENTEKATKRKKKKEHRKNRRSNRARK